MAETISRVRAAGAHGDLTLRADSGFYTGAVVSAYRHAGVVFSVTARKNAAIRRAIDVIPDDAWTPIPYWLDGGADVAETTYTALLGNRTRSPAGCWCAGCVPLPDRSWPWTWWDSVSGTSKDGILSPLFANIALSVLDEHFAEPWQEMGDSSARHRLRRRGLATHRLIRDADDFVVMVDGTREHAE